MSELTEINRKLDLLLGNSSGNQSDADEREQRRQRLWASMEKKKLKRILKTRS